MKFQVGDKVKVTSIAERGRLLVGETGTIVEIDPNYEYPYEVKYDNKEIKTQYVLFKGDEIELIDRNITLTKEQALKILACLGSSVYMIDGEFIKTDEDRRTLIHMSSDIGWDIAEQLGIDLNDYYVDFNTLDVKEY